MKLLFDQNLSPKLPVGDLVPGQTALDRQSLIQSVESLLRATAEAGSFAQKGRMYWSSDVAEHHQFWGQGAVDQEQVEKAAREVRILEVLKQDLEVFEDFL